MCLPHGAECQGCQLVAYLPLALHQEKPDEVFGLELSVSLLHADTGLKSVLSYSHLSLKLKMLLQTSTCETVPC